MAYSTNGLHCLATCADGPALWSYTSADAVASVIGASYFTDGTDRGLKLGDFILIYDTNTNDGAIAIVTDITSGAASAAEYQAITT